jgi:hypothetical protein
MFRKKLTEIALPVALALFAASAQAATVELTTNGGFETGTFSGWAQFPNASGTQTIVTTNPSSGTYAAFLDPVTKPGDNLIKQANVGIGLVNPGDVVTISFDYRGTASAGGVIFAEFFSELSGGGTSAAEILTGGPLFPNADPNVWTTYSGTAIAGPDVSGGVTLQLKAGNGGDPNSLAQIYFDNASMTIDVAAVPVPAAVWLFGSGLVGLVGVARRKKKSA